MIKRFLGDTIKKTLESIEHSAIRRGFGDSSTNFVKLHLIKEVGEVIVADSEDNFFEELSDVIILSLSGERMNHWWCADSPLPIPEDRELLMLLLAKLAGTLNRVNSLPHTILQWAVDTNNEQQLREAFNKKVLFNETR